MLSFKVAKKTDTGKRIVINHWEPETTPDKKEDVKSDQIDLFLQEFGYSLSNKKYRDEYYSISAVMSALSAVKTFYESKPMSWNLSEITKASLYWGCR